MKEFIITILTCLIMASPFIIFFAVVYWLGKRTQKRMKDDIIDIVRELKKKEE